MGWLDYPGTHLFSRPYEASLELSGGLSRHHSCGYPFGIYFQDRPWCHLTPNWHFFSRPLVASLELSGGISRHYSCGYPFGISFQDRPWCHLTPNWHFFSRPLVASLEFTGGLSRHYSCGHPTGISFDFIYLSLTHYIHYAASLSYSQALLMSSCHIIICMPY
jgi:hypothetical protein